jgi:hypothetical protein
MAMQGSIVPRKYDNTLSSAPYPTVAVPGVPSLELGEIFTCSYTGRAWIASVNATAVTQPLALQWQWTSTNAGTTLANIRRINSGVTADAVAGFEHTGAIVFSDILSAPMLGTDANGRVQAVTAAPAVTITARNNSGAQINKGQAVRISGALGQNPTISLAQANAYATTDAIGLAAANIGNNSTGSVIIAGTLTGLNTNAYTDGAVLYLSSTTAGDLTTTEPSRPNWQMQMGYVEHAHPTQGKILVRANLESTKTEYISDMTVAGEAFATFPDITPGRIIGRGGSQPSAGEPEELTLGYGWSFTGLTGTTANVSLSYTSSFITSDVSLVNANTMYDVTSLSLGAGTWLITANATMSSTVAATTQYTIELQNSSTSATLASCSTSHGAATGLSVNASANAVVQLSSTTTIKLRATANQATRVVKYQSFPNNLDRATGLVAVRIV